MSPAKVVYRMLMCFFVDGVYIWSIVCFLARHGERVPRTYFETYRLLFCFRSFVYICVSVSLSSGKTYFCFLLNFLYLFRRLHELEMFMQSDLQDVSVCMWVYVGSYACVCVRVWYVTKRLCVCVCVCVCVCMTCMESVIWYLAKYLVNVWTQAVRISRSRHFSFTPPPGHVIIGPCCHGDPTDPPVTGPLP